LSSSSRPFSSSSSPTSHDHDEREALAHRQEYERVYGSMGVRMHWDHKLSWLHQLETNEVNPCVFTW
jgi:hypothetical protein